MSPLQQSTSVVVERERLAAPVARPAEAAVRLDELVLRGLEVVVLGRDAAEILENDPANPLVVGESKGALEKNLGIVEVASRPMDRRERGKRFGVQIIEACLTSGGNRALGGRDGEAPLTSCAMDAALPAERF